MANFLLPQATGNDFKQSVKVATTGSNITLSGTQTIDGIALSAGDRVLVKDQTTSSQNGIYNVQSGSWTRSTDADSSAKLNSASVVMVEQGTINADTGWTLTTDGSITLGSTALTFKQVMSTTANSVFTTTSNGLVPMSTTSNTTDYLRRDGTWATPSGGVVFTGADGTNAGTSGLVPAPASTANIQYLRGDGTWATPPGTNYSTFTTSTDGLVPHPSTSNTTDFLRRDGTWATPAYPVTSVAGKTGAVTLASADISDATNANTANMLVKRDASGNFSAGTITASLSGNASSATNISNTGTVTLASATENNAITVTAPSYVTDKPVKLLNFNWYSDTYSVGIIRSGSTPSNGLGIFFGSNEIARFTPNYLRFDPQGTATSTTNYAGNYIQFQNSTWNGSAAVTNTRNLFLDVDNGIKITNVGAGSNVINLDANGNVIANGNFQAGGKFLAAEGSGTAGGYSFTNDGSQDTGMFSPSDGDLHFYSNNVDVVEITGTAVTIKQPATMNSTLNVNGLLTATSLGYQDNGLYIPFPKGASYATTTTTVTGAIKVVLPVGYTSTMMRFAIDVYNYATDTSFTIYVGGYNYSGTPGWINTVAYTVGNSSGLDYNVRFGYDGTRCLVYIGEINTSWSYPQVTVRDFYAGYGNYTLSSWASGWSIGFEASAFQNVTATQTNNMVVASAAKNLVTSRTLSWTGDATGSLNFDGSGNASASLTLASVMTAGTYPKVTVNAKGLVTGSSSLLSSDVSDATSANTANMLVKRDASGNFSASTITASGGLVINQDGVQNSSTGNITLKHPTGGGYSSIVFPSTANAGSDYGYIKYMDNNSTYALWGASSENSALIIGVQNDGLTVSSDSLVLQPAAALFVDLGDTAGSGSTTGGQGAMYIGSANGGSWKTGASIDVNGNATFSTINNVSVNSHGIRLLQSVDTRNAFDIPYQNISAGSTQYGMGLDFKGTSVTGLPSAWSGVMTVAHYGDSSGGYPHQLAFNQDGNMYHRLGTTTAKSAWTANTAYSSGNYVQPVTNNGHYYIANNTGTSTGTEPSWPTGSATTVQDAPTAVWAASTAYALNALIVPSTSNGFYYKATTAGTSGSAAPTWPTTAGNTVTDGTVTWTTYAIITWKESGTFWGIWSKLITDDGYGNVGINTLSPSAYLHIKGPNSSTTNNTLKVETAGGFDYGAGIVLQNSNTAQGASSNNYGRIQLIFNGQTQNSNDSWSLNGRSEIVFNKDYNATGTYSNSYALQHRMDIDQLGIINNAATPILLLNQSGGVTTIKNTLDDGSGNMTVAGNITINGSATVTSASSGSPFKLLRGSGNGDQLWIYTDDVYTTIEKREDDGPTTAALRFRITNSVNGTPSSMDALTIRGDGLVTTKNNTLDDGSGNATFSGTVTSSQIKLDSQTVGSANTGSGRFAKYDRAVGSIVAQLGNNGGTGQTFDIIDSSWSKQLFHVGNDNTVSTYHNTIDDGSGNATFTGTLQANSQSSVQSHNGSTLVTTFGYAAAAGNYFNGTSVNDIILRNEANTNIDFGFYGASGNEAPALKLSYNGGTGKASVSTQRNTLDDGSGNMTINNSLNLTNTSSSTHKVTLEYNSSTNSLDVIFS